METQRRDISSTENWKSMHKFSGKFMVTLVQIFLFTSGPNSQHIIRTKMVYVHKRVRKTQFRIWEQIICTNFFSVWRPCPAFRASNVLLTFSNSQKNAADSPFKANVEEALRPPAGPPEAHPKPPWDLQNSQQGSTKFSYAKHTPFKSCNYSQAQHA